jgi:TPR repeat protein
MSDNFQIVDNSWENDSEECVDIYNVVKPLPYIKLFFSRDFKMGEEQKFLIQKNKADAGDAQAQYDVGMYYEDGIGVPQSYETAFHYYECAAFQGHSMGLCKLGEFYAEGLGVERSYESAFRYYEAAAKMENTKALVCIGKLYEEGKGVKKSIKKALQHYQQGADQNESLGWTFLAEIYEKGIDVESSQKRANFFYHERFEYHKRLAEQGDVDAQFAWGLDYQNGWGVEQSYRFALDCFEWAAEQSCIRALIFAGDYFAQGLVGKKSAEWAIYYYELAACQGNPFAQAVLGPYLLLHEKKISEGVAYLNKAVEERQCPQELIAECEYYLGKCFEKGIKCEKSDQKALAYYQSSASSGNEQALQRLRTACLRGEFGLEQTPFFTFEGKIFSGLRGHTIQDLKKD